MMKFDGLAIDSADLMMMRVVEPPYPLDWESVVFENPEFQSVRTLTAWTIKNTEGRFGILTYGTLISILFESHYDAITFKLRDGMHWYQDEEQ